MSSGSIDTGPGNNNSRGEAVLSTCSPQFQRINYSTGINSNGCSSITGMEGGSSVTVRECSFTGMQLMDRSSISVVTSLQFLGRWLLLCSFWGSAQLNLLRIERRRVKDLSLLQPRLTLCDLGGVPHLPLTLHSHSEMITYELAYAMGKSSPRSLNKLGKTKAILAI